MRRSPLLLLVPLLLTLAACARGTDGQMVTSVTFNPFYLGMGFLVGNTIARLARKGDDMKWFDGGVIILSIVLMGIGYLMVN